MENDARKTDRPFAPISVPIYLSAGHTAHSKEHTGIQRVTRSLARELQASGLRVEFLEWVQSKRRYVVLNDQARRRLAREGGPPYESLESLFGRVVPEAGRLLPSSDHPDRSSEMVDPSIREDRIIHFESIIRSIHHPMPGVPGWIGYLPVPLSFRRGLRRGIRQTVNQFVRGRDRWRIRRYIREIVKMRRVHNQMTRRILKLSERRKDSEFRLAFMEHDAWRYKQRRDGLARDQEEDNGLPASASPEPESGKRDTSPDSQQEVTLQAPDEAELFSLTHRLEPTRFKPVKGAWVVVPELMRPEEMRRLTRYCRRHRLNLAVMFHDAIAVTHPELVAESIRRSHAAYMRHLCRADLVLAVSRQSADDLKDFAQSQGIDLPPITICANGASFPGERIPVEPTPPPPIRAICVGTIDPRKNHRTLIAALDNIHQHHPSLDLRVTLIGNAYAGSDDLVRLVREACGRLPGLEWIQGAEDRELIEAYENCHFTIFPSVIEGFGIPVLESMWHGRPCICSATGAVGERASGGGCVTIDVTNPDDLAGAILRMAQDEPFRRQLTNEANSRVLRTWREQALDLVEGLSDAVPRYQLAKNQSDTLLT